VQDFSYCSIYLLCSIGGKSRQQWVAAGDTAYMIWPGCSFTFDGLKQTLMAVNQDNVSKLKKVVQLRRNYRMTRGVLEVGNAILKVITQFFPFAIEYTKPEIAMKDLGLRVVVCSWEDAMKSYASFGTDQAIVYSSSTDMSALSDQITKWLGNHPFLPTSLDSKGLEFEDVVVAFDCDRSTWNVSSNSMASLRMLRELYVAVARAKRRVVVLVKKNESAMEGFVRSLEANIEESEAEVILKEFEKVTTPTEWFEQGKNFFDDLRYNLSASCFVSAGDYGWSCWARGRHLEETGESVSAKRQLRLSPNSFFDSVRYEKCLDVMSELAEFLPWEDHDNEVLDAALKKDPDICRDTTPSSLPCVAVFGTVS
jgi:hypothetical protein